MGTFLSGVGKVGATYDAVGSIVGAILVAFIGIVCIMMGVTHTKYSTTSRTDEFCNIQLHQYSTCADGCENKGGKCVPKLDEEKAGTGFIVGGVFVLIIAALIVWSALFWRRAVYNDEGVAKVGGLAYLLSLFGQEVA